MKGMSFTPCGYGGDRLSPDQVKREGGAANGTGLIGRVIPANLSIALKWPHYRQTVNNHT